MKLFSFLQPKALRLRVTDGVDEGKKIWIYGDRLVIGSGASADLQMYCPGVREQHLVLTAAESRRWGKQTSWFYTLADDADNLIDGAYPPRSGEAYRGQRFRLGPFSDLVVEEHPVSDDTPEELTKSSNTFRVPASKLWAVQLLLISLMIMLLIAAFNFSTANIATISSADARPTQLEFEKLFCAIVKDDELNAQQSPLLTDLADCLRVANAASVTQEDKDMLHTRITQAYIALASDAPIEASRILVSLQQELGNSQCAISRKIRTDLEVLPSVSKHTPCPEE